MSKYTAIADVSAALVELLRANLVPEPIMNPAQIDLCFPYEKGDLLLGVYLYEVRNSESVRVTNKINVNVSEQQYPPVHLSLYYMITAFSASDLKFRAMDDYKILGRVMQTLYDNAVIDLKKLNANDQSLIQNIRLEMLNPDSDERGRLWAFPNLPYRLSLFYKAGPVEIESTKYRTVKRIVDMKIDLEENEG